MHPRLRAVHHKHISSAIHRYSHCLARYRYLRDPCSIRFQLLDASFIGNVQPISWATYRQQIPVATKLKFTESKMATAFHPSLAFLCFSACAEVATFLVDISTDHQHELAISRILIYPIVFGVEYIDISRGWVDRYALGVGYLPRQPAASFAFPACVAGDCRAEILFFLTRIRAERNLRLVYIPPKHIQKFTLRTEDPDTMAAISYVHIPTRPAHSNTANAQEFARPSAIAFFDCPT